MRVKKRELAVTTTQYATFEVDGLSNDTQFCLVAHFQSVEKQADRYVTESDGEEMSVFRGSDILPIYRHLAMGICSRRFFNATHA